MCYFLGQNAIFFLINIILLFLRLEIPCKDWPYRQPFVEGKPICWQIEIYKEKCFLSEYYMNHIYADMYPICRTYMGVI